MSFQEQEINSQSRQRTLIFDLEIRMISFAITGHMPVKRPKQKYTKSRRLLGPAVLFTSYLMFMLDTIHSAIQIGLRK